MPVQAGADRAALPLSDADAGASAIKAAERATPGDDAAALAAELVRGTPPRPVGGWRSAVGF